MPPPLPPRGTKETSSQEKFPRMKSSPGEFGYQEQHEAQEMKRVVSPRSLPDEQPETAIGKNVIVNGTLKFDWLVRIDGSFTGQLVSQGNLVVGETGKLEGNIDGMSSVLIDGKVIGNIMADTVCLRNQAAVFGNITCKSITVEPQVTVVGEVNINPRAPQLFDINGNEITRD